jgi:aminomethyltransferase
VGTAEGAKRTPLYEEHVRLGGRMMAFAGYELPVQYTSVLAEHRAVREAVGVFDVSHMGEILVEGERAAAFLDHLVTNRPSALAVGAALYTPMCAPDGGVVDDLLVYRLAEAAFLLVVNAANTDSDRNWIEGEAALFGGVAVHDRSEALALIAVQGPKAASLLGATADADLSGLRAFRFRDGVRVAGRRALVSRTGYTGEDGFELYLAPEDAAAVFRALVESGRSEGGLPCGLGARDTLRFEACLPLYGQELTRDVTPLQAGLGAFVKLDKPDFVGRGALLEEQRQGPARRLVGFTMVDRGIPRHGYEVVSGGRSVGWVTSGMYAPTLGANLGLAYVPASHAEVGRDIGIVVRGRVLMGRVVETPIYRRRRGT